MVVDRLPVEQGADDLDELGEALLASGGGEERHAGGGELRRRVPGTEAELDTAAAQAVERRHLPSDHQRMVEAGVEHERADADPFRRLRGGCQALQRAPVAADVVGHEDDVEAELLGAPGVRGDVRRVVGAELQPEPHRGVQMTTIVVPTGANAHRNAASGLAWRWQPPDSRVPSSASVW